MLERAGFKIIKKVSKRQLELIVHGEEQKIRIGGREEIFFKRDKVTKKKK